jgi:hypothetical protein
MMQVPDLMTTPAEEMDGVEVEEHKPARPERTAGELAAVLKAMDEAQTLEALAATSEAASRLKGQDKNEARKRFLGRQASIKAEQMRREHAEFVEDYDAAPNVATRETSAVGEFL